MRRRRAFVTLTAAFSAIVAIGCANEADSEPPLVEGDAAPWPGEAATATERDLGVGLVVELPDGWEVIALGSSDLHVGEDSDCPQLFGSLSDGQDFVELELNGSGCAGQEQDSVGNGYHGIYVGLDDVPEPLDVEEQDVPLGHLTTFSQDYFECTNECNDYQDNVALVELATPPDPTYPTLVLLSPKGDVPPDRLAALAQAIHPA